MVVLPEDSGPKISTTRPRGKPPTPSAASKEIAPVGITAMGTIFLRAQPHDGAFAKLLFDLRKRQIDCFSPFVSHKNAAPFEL